MTEIAPAAETVIRRYTFKLYPNSGQAAVLDEQRRMCGRLWNALLDQQERWYLLGEILPLAEIIRYQRMRAGQIDQHMVDWRKGRWDEEDGEKVYVPGGERDWRKARIAEAKAAKRKRLSAFDQGKEITKLRHACPEFQRLSSDTEARVADMLSEAFKGFFRRAKAGEPNAGYPRFKAVDRFETIPFREMGRGWRLRVDGGLCEPGLKEQKALEFRSLLDSPPCGNPDFEGQTQDHHPPKRRGVPCGNPDFEGQTQAYSGRGSPKRPCGNPDFEGKTQVTACGDVAAPACGGPEFEGLPRGPQKQGWRPAKWRVYVKGVTGLVRARGQLPRDPISWKTAEIIWRNGNWWLSLVVEMSTARKAGSDDLKVVFDLVDEFARVERVEGPMSGPRESANSDPDQGDSNASAADTLGLGADDRLDRRRRSTDCAADTLGLGADDRKHGDIDIRSVGADTLGLAKGFRKLAILEQRIDALKSERDLRFIKFSCRWRAAGRRIASLTSYSARYRGNLLHGWTTRIVASASSLDVTAPAVKQSTATARGNEKQHGAAVRTVAELNRHVLNQAPGSALQMLSYKAKEAAIPFVLHKDEYPVVSVGHDISTVTKAARKARRIIKKAIAA